MQGSTLRIDDELLLVTRASSGSITFRRAHEQSVLAARAFVERVEEPFQRGAGVLGDAMESVLSRFVFFRMRYFGEERG